MFNFLVFHLRGKIKIYNYFYIIIIHSFLLVILEGLSILKNRILVFYIFPKFQQIKDLQSIIIVFFHYMIM